jgi:hypothetical protein
MRTRFLLGFLAYVLPTFPLAWFWHMTVFKSYYDALEVYRDDLLVPLGLAAMAIQGVAWVYVYSQLFAGETVLRGAVKFAALAAPLAWSFMVLAVAAKHQMTSPANFLLIETGFIALQYAVVCPLLALAFARTRASAEAVGA